MDLTFLDPVTEYFQDVGDYFQHLNMYQAIAWGCIGLGLILIVVAIILW
tara:strand:- start:912 stop:1058 length:147 start_codon:yes stop_codon:yes gene_type:complete